MSFKHKFQAALNQQHLPSNSTAFTIIPKVQAATYGLPLGRLDLKHVQLWKCIINGKDEKSCFDAGVHLIPHIFLSSLCS